MCGTGLRGSRRGSHVEEVFVTGIEGLGAGSATGETRRRIVETIENH